MEVSRLFRGPQVIYLHELSSHPASQRHVPHHQPSGSVQFERRCGATSLYNYTLCLACAEQTASRCLQQLHLLR